MQRAIMAFKAQLRYFISLQSYYSNPLIKHNSFIMKQQHPTCTHKIMNCYILCINNGHESNLLCQLISAFESFSASVSRSTTASLGQLLKDTFPTIAFVHEIRECKNDIVPFLL